MRLSILLFLILSKSFAQKHDQNWYFGQKAGLTFTGGQPVALVNSAMTAIEGCASISDDSGNLLFYSNGDTIFDRTHSVMANGIGLDGQISSTQSSLIIRNPGSNTLYYLFTTDQATGNSGLNYHIIDMSLAAGNGSVVSKNNQIFAPASERLAATVHCNGNDYWVLAHAQQSAQFAAFLLTNSGVAVNPVMSNIGTAVTQLQQRAGNMRFSPDGRKLLCAYNWNSTQSNSVELFDFDSSTGLLSNPLALSKYVNAYGCEFSPDGSKAYVSLSNYDTSSVIQFDLCQSTPQAVVNSATNLFSIKSDTTIFKTLQLATDGKIYVAPYYRKHLAVINDPNQAGPASDFQNLGPDLAGRRCNYGLPNLITRLNASFSTHSISCNSYTFENTSANMGCSNNNTLSRQWDFGDPLSGPANTSTLDAPLHSYSAAGVYTVSYTETYNCTSSTVTKTLMVIGISPSLALNVQGALCIGASATITATGATNYSWTSGAVTPSISLTPTAGASYTVLGWNTTQLCASQQTFTVSGTPCAGLEHYGLESLIVFPNPAQNWVEINYSPFDLNIGTITLCDVLGREQQMVIRPSEPGKFRILFSELVSGLYFLSFTANKGVVIQKILIGQGSR